ncbi:MAG: hypothetical protein ACXVRW_08185 [Solirubrobacteraceae bacterium]
MSIATAAIRISRFGVKLVIGDGADSRYGAGEEMVGVRRCVGIVLAAAASATVLLGAVRVEADGAPAAAQVAAPTPDALVARLAVLRRPQTPADRLPPGMRLARPGGRILSGLTRLVATLPGNLNVYLAVTTPTGGSPPLWSPRLGDQVTVVATGPDAAAFDDPYPAVNLDDPFVLGSVGDLRPHSPLTGAYNIAILPDGVSRVRWRFANRSGARDAVRTVPVTNNVAITPSGPNENLVDGATWYAPDGTTVPTSDAALVRALAAREAVLKARAIRYAQHHSHRADPSLLSAFAVFSVTSRRPVREPGGITVTWPRLTDVPLIILDLTAHGLPRLDDGQMRAIVTRSGDEMWLIPGAHGLCLAVLDKPLSASPLSGRGAGAACGTDLAELEAQGIGLGEGGPRGSFSYGVLPRSKPTITVRIRGRQRVIRPPLGVYVLHHGRHQGSPSTVIVSPTGG